MSSPPGEPSTKLGLASLATIVLLAGALGYYQFVFLPTTVKVEGPARAPPEVLNPPESVTIEIVDGAFSPENEEFYVPKEVTVILGKNNRVIWVNGDIVSHTVTSDAGEKGARDFDRAAKTLNWVEEGSSWSFTFTEPGTYKYHCTPHPWMKAVIIVVAGP